MKIKQEHFEHMRKKISDYLEGPKQEKLIAKYEAGDFIHSDRVKDLQRRFCFDLMYLSGLTDFVVFEIYSYADDNHLYTALKKICPKIKRGF